MVLSLPVYAASWVSLVTSINSRTYMAPVISWYCSMVEPWLSSTLPEPAQGSAVQGLAQASKERRWPVALPRSAAPFNCISTTTKAFFTETLDSARLKFDSANDWLVFEFWPPRPSPAYCPARISTVLARAPGLALASWIFCGKPENCGQPKKPQPAASINIRIDFEAFFKNFGTFFIILP